MSDLPDIHRRHRGMRLAVIAFLAMIWGGVVDEACAQDSPTQAISLQETLVESLTQALPEVWFGSPLIGTPLANIARAGMRFSSDLVVFDLPFELPPQPFRLVWHRRNDQEPCLLWLRSLVSPIAEQVVGASFIRKRPAAKSANDVSRFLKAFPATLSDGAKRREKVT